MTERKSNQKVEVQGKPDHRVRTGRPGQSGLYMACFAAGISVSTLAERVGHQRSVLYLAFETPSRYSRVYRKIKKALQ